MKLKDGEPCDHAGCLSHVTHPCEGCGRIAGKTRQKIMIIGGCGANLDTIKEALAKAYPEGVELINGEDAIPEIEYDRFEGVKAILPFCISPKADLEAVTKLPKPQKPPAFKSRHYRKKK